MHYIFCLLGFSKDWCYKYMLVAIAHSWLIAMQSIVYP